METLLAILLYMQMVTSPGAYTKTEIEMFEQKHYKEIETIQRDDEQMKKVEMEYLPRVRDIIIIDEHETYNTKPLRDFRQKKMTDCFDMIA